MTQVLLSAYRLAEQRGGPEAAEQFRRRLTPYDRGVLERALANEAEMRAFPLPSDPKPVRVVSSPVISFVSPTMLRNVAFDALQRMGMTAGLVAVHFGRLNDQLAWAQRAYEEQARNTLRAKALGCEPDQVDLVLKYGWAPNESPGSLNIPEPDRPPERRSFRDGLRRPWWER